MSLSPVKAEISFTTSFYLYCPRLKQEYYSSSYSGLNMVNRMDKRCVNSTIKNSDLKRLSAFLLTNRIPSQCIPICSSAGPTRWIYQTY